MSNHEFSSSFDQLRAPLYGFALNLTKDEEAAKDLLQETAYKAFKYRNRFEPQTNLRAWLMTIMRNSFINDYRKTKRRKTLNDRTTNDYFIDSGNVSVENEGVRTMTMEELQQEIDRLEDWVRIPFLMFYQGFKYEEIAESLDVPLGTVKSRIFFARKRLKSRINSIYNASEFADLIAG